MPSSTIVALLAFAVGPLTVPICTLFAHTVVLVTGTNAFAAIKALV